MITDAEGKEFDPAGFEKLLGPGYTWSPQEPLSLLPQYQATALQPQEPEEEAGQSADATVEDETETLESGSFDERESIEESEHDEDLEPLEETDEYDDFEPFDDAEEFEDELEPHH